VVENYERHSTRPWRCTKEWRQRGQTGYEAEWHINHVADGTVGHEGSVRAIVSTTK
jgi:hypothetical protein